jgi:hypothetical protein
MFRFMLCGAAALMVGFIGGRTLLAPEPVRAATPYVPTITVPSAPSPARAPSQSDGGASSSEQTQPPAAAPRPAERTRVAAEPSTPPRPSAGASRRGKKARVAAAAKKPGKRSARLARRAGRDDDDDC